MYGKGMKYKKKNCQSEKEAEKLRKIDEKLLEREQRKIDRALK